MLLISKTSEHIISIFSGFTLKLFLLSMANTLLCGRTKVSENNQSITKEKPRKNRHLHNIFSLLLLSYVFYIRFIYLTIVQNGGTATLN